MLPEEDIVRLRHMLDAAEEALEFARGRSRADLDTDRMFARAVVQDIEIVGEAAGAVSRETRICTRTYPGPPLRPCAIVSFTSIST